ncbi:thiol-disulfide oxidoreductase DCC family protein [uncultured Methylobacterium sp.]|uniref:thiol-disulfide oxidoreductase DCC family protein n=1 Tax=uncultured Methylobacterium sp. TaxID=157278 RepID=UPI0035C98B3C
MQDATLTVYYDGACPLCRAEIGHYRRCRGAERIAFVDVAPDAPGQEFSPGQDLGPGQELGPDQGLGPGLDRAAARRRFHVRDADGRLRSGAAAFARLWSVLPGWRWLGLIARLPPVLPVAEAAYRAFLPLRPRLARLLVRGG